MKTLLILVARLHRKNWRRGRWNYPQLFYCWPRWTSRKNKRIFRIRTALCGLICGHEISKTEWGYGGGALADCNCRWCDKTIQVPIDESPAPALLADLTLTAFGRNGHTE